MIWKLKIKNIKMEFYKMKLILLKNTLKMLNYFNNK